MSSKTKAKTDYDNALRLQNFPWVHLLGFALETISCSKLNANFIKFRNNAAFILVFKFLIYFLKQSQFTVQIKAALVHTSENIQLLLMTSLCLGLCKVMSTS